MVLTLPTPSFSAQTFEVVSVRPVADSAPSLAGPLVDARTRFRGGPDTSDPGRINYRGVTIKMLLERTFGLSPEQVEGPNWIDTQRYDIAANLHSGTTQQQLSAMLRALLKERFSLSFHYINRRTPTYHLTVREGRPKLRSAPLPGGTITMAETMRRAEDLAAAGGKAGAGEGGSPIGINGVWSLSEFAAVLSSYVDRPVKDFTNMDGKFQIALSWTSARPGPFGGQADASIFSAIKDQLGLSLVSAADPIDILVIDNVTRMPSDN